ncbi:MAG: extracellular solute-binding protein [Phycisphaerales bacterium]
MTHDGRIQTISRRAALGALAAAGAGFALFGPRRAGDAPAGRTVIDYWEKWTGQEGEAMGRVIDAFNRSQDRIWVRYFATSAIDQKALVSIAGNDPPALVGLWNFSLPMFVESRAVMPLTELDAAYGAEISRAFAERGFARDFRIRRENYTEPAWRIMHHRGVMGGVVNTCSSMAYYYDKSAYREVGLDPEQPPRTIAELDEHAERLTIMSGGKVERSGFLQREPGWWNWLWGYFFGGSLYDAETETATAASPETVRGYEWVQSYPKKFGAQRLVAFQSGFGGYNSAQQALLVGKVASVLHGPFLVNVIDRFKPGFDYGAAPFPVAEEIYDPDRPVGLLESDSLCIPRGCPHPREAYEFLMFTQLPENVEALAIAHAKPTPLAHPSDDFIRRHPNKYVAMHNKLVASPRAFPKPLTRAWPQYESEFNAEIGTMWELTRSAADVLADIQRRAQRFIDVVVERRERRYGRDVAPGELLSGEGAQS